MWQVSDTVCGYTGGCFEAVEGRDAGY